MRKKEKLVKLEAIRGFAAIYVMFHHLFASGLIIFGVNFSFLFRFGQEAVILFFLLSGFVIYYSFQNSKNKSLKTFFWKRALRIYIPLFFVFLMNYLLISLYDRNFVKINWGEFFGNIFMLQDNVGKKPNVICAPFLNNDPLWSLSYEWWFYFMFFFLMRHVKNNLDKLVYFSGIIAAISYLVYPFFINREIMYFSIWWTGLAIARLYLRKEKISFYNLRFPLLSLFLITIILLINILIFKYKESGKVFELSAYPILEFRHFATSLLFVIFALAWHKLKWIGFNVTLLPFKYIAPISFVIYISHWFLVYQAHYLDILLLDIKLTLLINVFVCLAFSYIVEKVLYPKFYNYLKPILKF